MPDDPQAGQEPNESTTSNEATQDDGEPFDKERALATISKLREFEKLSKTQKRELDDLRVKVKAADDAKLSETEKLTQRVAEAEQARQADQQALREERVRNAVLVAAQKLGAVDGDAVYRLLDRESLEFDSQGRPQDVDGAVKALLKERPYLSRGNGSADGGAGDDRRRAGDDMNTAIRRAMGRA